MVAHAMSHPLRLTAPWYRWTRQRAEGRAPRATRPVFLKYDTPDMVNMFLKNPQRSYMFDDDDFVLVTASSPYAPAKAKIRGLADRIPIQCDVRKLFRETHKRNYLVTLEMHCEMPGLPDAGWDHICELGFVVRRWVPKDPAGLKAQADTLDDRIGVLAAILLRLGDPLPTPLQLLLLRDSTVAGETPPEILVALTDAVERVLLITQLTDELQRARAARIALERPNPAGWKLQYWRSHADEHDKIGDWTDVVGTTQQLFLREKQYRLYRLIPDPKEAGHLSLGARLLFGCVPTGDMVTNDAGEPHFDYEATYEIQAFVRQHKRGCPLRLNEKDCHGPLVWSPPTEPYRIAAHFDPAGNRHMVVNVEMPDMKLLAATPHKFENVSIRLNWPSGSEPTLTGFSLGPMTCFKSIPLVTLVATILLEIFTPIIVNILHVYYLLYDNVCIGAPALPPFPALPPLPAMDPKDPLNMGAEYDITELGEIEASILSARTISRTRPLKWEQELKVRPRVDDPMLLAAVHP